MWIQYVTFIFLYTVPEHMVGTKQLPHTASYKLLQLLVTVLYLDLEVLEWGKGEGTA